ncbi:hypothetical protein AAKU61_004474, partial [Undibacterium sp. GrIS 1.2]
RMKTETIGMAYMQNVGMGRMDNVGMGYSLNVGLIMSTIVGMNQITKVGVDYSNTAGKTYSLEVGGSEGSSFKMDAESIVLNIGKSSITMKKTGEITIVGDKLEIVGETSVSIISPDIHNN